MTSVLWRRRRQRSRRRPSEHRWRLQCSVRARAHSRSSNLTWPPATSMYALFFFFLPRFPYICYTQHVHTRRRQRRRRPLWHTFGYHTRVQANVRRTSAWSLSHRENGNDFPAGLRGLRARRALRVRCSTPMLVGTLTCTFRAHDARFFIRTNKWSIKTTSRFAVTYRRFATHRGAANSACEPGPDYGYFLSIPS